MCFTHVNLSLPTKVESLGRSPMGLAATGVWCAWLRVNVMSTPLGPSRDGQPTTPRGHPQGQPGRSPLHTTDRSMLLSSRAPPIWASTLSLAQS